MALIRDFEIAGTGLVVPNAYHVITQLDVEKRLADRNMPQPNGRVYQGGQTDYDMEWTAGYYGRMSICVWKDAASRTAAKTMVSFFVVLSIQVPFKGLVFRAFF
jgi:hypothetical protein